MHGKDYMVKVSHLVAREILDSRGNPTVEVDLQVDGGKMGRFAVPSGASTGEHEALEMRDGRDRYLGKGVQQAVRNVNNVISGAILNRSFESQEALDEALIQLDGTPNKSSLGANAILGVSLAFAKACALQSGLPLYQFLGGENANLLPTPMMNVINGGAHADNALMVQEIMIVPWGAPSFSEALRYGAEVFHTLKSTLKSKGSVTAVGDEGGFAPDFKTLDEALDTVSSAIEQAGFRLGDDIVFALDAAASEFYDSKEKTYELEPGKYSDLSACLDFWASQVKARPIVSLEDPLDENDWEGWSELTKGLGGQIQIVGDDLFVTNPQLVQKGIEIAAANAVLVKINQIGTLTETLRAMDIAKNGNMGRVMSHRSGETEDSTIADLAVATSCGQIKTGSLCRSDRVAKYNQLLRIEGALGETARFAGKDAILASRD